MYVVLTLFYLYVGLYTFHSFWLSHCLIDQKICFLVSLGFNLKFFFSYGFEFDS